MGAPCLSTSTAPAPPAASDLALEKHQGMGWGGTGTLVVCSITVQLLQSLLVRTDIANGERGICYTKSDHWDISSCTFLLEVADPHPLPEGSPGQT